MKRSSIENGVLGHRRDTTLAAGEAASADYEGPICELWMFRLSEDGKTQKQNAYMHAQTLIPCGIALFEVVYRSIARSSRTRLLARHSHVRAVECGLPYPSSTLHGTAMK